MPSPNEALIQGSIPSLDHQPASAPHKIGEPSQLCSPQAPPEQNQPHAPKSRGHLLSPVPAVHQYPPQLVNSPPSLYGGWGGCPSSDPYGVPSPPTLGQPASVPNPSLAAAAAFPDSPPMMDASQMLMSPSRFRKRRHLSPLISGYADPFKSPTMQQVPGGSPYIRRYPPVPKIPMSPRSYSAGSSPKSAKATTLILPCFFDQSNQLRTHGPHLGMTTQSGPNPYWDDFARNMDAFLEEAARITEDTTIIEIKQLLRKFGINATGKKHVLADRIQQLQAYMKCQREQRSAMRQSAASPPPSSLPSESEGARPIANVTSTERGAPTLQ